MTLNPLPYSKKSDENVENTHLLSSRLFTRKCVPFTQPPHKSAEKIRLSQRTAEFVENVHLET